MGTKRTAEFRQEAVRVALTSELTRKQVASDFGIGFSTLSKWVQQDRKNPEKPTAQSDLERENAKLRKESRLLREEREELKELGLEVGPPGWQIDAPERHIGCQNP